MMNFRNILLVDDEPIVNYLNSFLFSEIIPGAKIVTLENGEQALKYIIEHCLEGNKDCPDVMIMDLNMPVMDGFSLLYELKELNKLTSINTRIAVLSSSDHTRDIAFLKEIGITEILSKPLTNKKATAALERLQNQSTCFFVIP